MNVFMMTTGEAGLDVFRCLRDEIPIKAIIGLSPRDPGDVISGYADTKRFCAEHQVEYIPVQDYTLRSEQDRSRLLSLDIDVLLVLLGWQRLLPGWLIEHSRIATIGTHGSATGITSGRGRSPQNWALMMGHTSFSVSIFRMDPGIDSGPLIDSAEFTLSPLDTIRTSYHKLAWTVAQLTIRNYRSGNLFSSAMATAQQGNVRYLPQRRPEDGEIDWTLNAPQVHDFIRALCRPYPGAFTRFKREVITLWDAIPFDIDETPPSPPGTIVKVYYCGDILISTGKGHILVREYSSTGALISFADEGAQLSSANAVQQLDAIFVQHRRRYPESPIADDLLAYFERLAAQRNGSSVTQS